LGRERRHGQVETYGNWYHSWSAHLSHSARRSRREQAGVDPQPCDQADMAAKCRNQVNGGEAGVGDNNQVAVR